MSTVNGSGSRELPPMVKPASAAPKARVTRELLVRVPNRKDKRFTVLRFHGADKVNIASQGSNNTEVFMQRENNMRIPKPVAGTPDKEIRRVYPNSMQNYRPEDQPWLMTVGKGRSSRKFRGVREGTISENVHYYLFCQTKDGHFEAHHVQDWYKMSAEVSYRYLKEEEAEEEFSRLSKCRNMFNIMVKRKITEEDGDQEKAAGKKGEKKPPSGQKKSKKSFKLTDIDELGAMSDADDDDEDEGDAVNDTTNQNSEEKAQKKRDAKDKEKKKQLAKVVSRKRQNVKWRKRKQHKQGDPYDSNNEEDEDYLDAEVDDESDPDDHLGDELDYMTNSSSDEDKLSDEEREKLYDAPGVDEEAGLKALLTDMSSSEESSGEEGKKDAKSKNKNSDADAKPEEETKKSRKRKGANTSDESESSGDEAASSGSAASSSTSDSSDDESVADEDAFEKKNTKKLELLQELSKNALGMDPSAKRAKLDGAGSSQAQSSDAPAESELMSMVRKYLQRKPISVVDLLKKIKQKKLVPANTNAQVALADVLKELRPDKSIINGQPLLFLK